MKFKELKEISAAELNDKLKELRLELIKLKGEVAKGMQLKSPGKIRQIKKTIARILTLLAEKEAGKADQKKAMKEAQKKGTDKKGAIKEDSIKKEDSNQKEDNTRKESSSNKKSAKEE